MAVASAVASLSKIVMIDLSLSGNNAAVIGRQSGSCGLGKRALPRR